LLKQKNLPGSVISVGNITVGGTGKTPAVIMLAEWAFGNGRRVAVLTRGYGGRRREKVLFVSGPEGLLAEADEAGDEAYLLARRLHGIPVVVSSDRFDAGMAAHKKWESDFFIMDDGFQHLALKRQADLVLLDAGNPFGNGRLLPMGPLREPFAALKRADAIILTRSGGEKDKKLEQLLRGKMPSMNVFKAIHRPRRVVFPVSGQINPIGFLRGKRVLGFAGIGKPYAFREMLVDLGVDLVWFKGFGDHHKFKESELHQILMSAREKSVELVLTTEKDWSRLARLDTGRPEIGYVEIEFNILGDRQCFEKFIDGLITGN